MAKKKHSLDVPILFSLCAVNGGDGGVGSYGEHSNGNDKYCTKAIAKVASAQIC